MKLKIYFFGKKNEITNGENEYLRRINFRIPIELIALPQAGIKDEKKGKSQEANDVLSKISDQNFLIAWDENGKTFDSIKFSEWLKKTLETKKEIIFVIGGAYGLDEKILSRADEKISFGPMVWTKNLARFMAIEQVYRALEISGGSHFHKP